MQYIVRSTVIATKYAYYEKEDLERIEKGLDKWDKDASDRKMLLAGWCGTPRVLDGVLQTALDEAQRAVEVDLRKVMFRSSSSSSQDNCEGGIDKVDLDHGKEIPALDVLSRIVTSQFGESIFSPKLRFIQCTWMGTFTVALIAPATKFAFGMSNPFGPSWQSKLLTISFLIAGLIYGTLTLLLLVASCFDFYRRANAARMLSKVS